MFSKAFFLRVIKSQDCEVKSYLLQPFEVFLVSMAVDLYANKLLNTHDSLYFFAVLAETGNKKKKVQRKTVENSMLYDRNTSLEKNKQHDRI